MRAKISRRLSLGVIAVVSSFGSVAQDSQGNPTTENRSGNRMIEEVMVTAQKRVENVQDVPISIQAFSNEKLDALGVESTADLPRITPGLTVTTQVGYTVTYLRGLGSDAFLFADPSVVNYTDGVYYPYPLGQTTNFGDVERVEVLKGPQGTLFGRNAIGGAINVFTKDPVLTGPAASVRYSKESFSKESFRGTASIPIIEDYLAFSVSGIKIAQEYHINGRVNSIEVPGGEPLDPENTKAYRIKMLWAPTGNFELRLNKYYLDQSGTGTLYAVNVKPSDLAASQGVEARDPYAGINNEDIFFEQTVETDYGEARFYGDWFDVKLFASDQYIEVDQNYDFDGSEEALVYFEIDPGSSDVQTAELQVLSNNDSWGADWLEWIVGAYYFESVAGFDKLILRAASTNLEQGNILGMPLVSPEIQNAVSALDAPLPNGDIETISLLGTESLSYYTQITFDVLDQLSLTLGARYQEEDREVVRSAAGLRLQNGDLVLYQDQSSDNDPSLKERTTAFSPKVTVNYRPNIRWFGEDALLYATWQEATKSATFNVINFLDFEAEKVLAEEIEAYEIGIKTNLLDSTITLNAAAFKYVIENPQVQIVSVFEGGVVNFENAGEAQVEGADFDVLVNVFPSIFNSGIFGGLVFAANGSYLDTEYTEYLDGTGFAEGSGEYETGQNYSGNEVVRAPDWSGSVSLTQTFYTGWGPLEVSADYYYNGGFFYLAGNTSVSKEDSYSVLGARISYLLEDYGVRLAAFGRNINDAKYNYSRFITDFGALDARAPLANYGFSIEYTYDY